MTKILLFCLLFISGFTLSAQTNLSNEAEISVITCGPWHGELYAAFGHSAFRVYDPQNNIDEAYNYGVFNFNQPNFYLNFARGYLYYKLGVYHYQDFKNDYIYYNRYVHEQVLNLSPEQRQRVYDFLQWNARPENQYYRYDYFYDNCATKIRDVIVTVFKDSVHFDGSYITDPQSFRDLTDQYLVPHPWGDLGIDICLGLPMDKVASPYEHMFLPDYIESGFDHATIRQAGGIVPIVKEKRIVYESRPENFSHSFPHPLYVFTAFLVLAIVLSVVDFRRKKLSNWFDVLLFGLTGMIGWLLLFLWTATDHQAAARNLNILWALPTHLIAAIAIATNRSWLKKYFLFTSVFVVLVLIAWPFLPQELNLSLIPVVLTLCVRASMQYYMRNVRKAHDLFANANEQDDSAVTHSDV